MKIKISKKKIYLLLFLLSILLIYLSYSYRSELAGFTNLGMFGIFIANLIGSASLFIPAPAIATVLAGGIIYNPLLVAAVASIGSALGDMLGYVLGHAGKKVFIGKHPGWYSFLRETFNKFGVFFVITFAFIPNPFFDAIGIIAGIFSYDPKRFFVYILIGRFLRNLVLAYFGSSI